MDKVSEQIRHMMLDFPDLYHNRFEAFVELMTNSCYEWNEAGEIVSMMSNNRPVTQATMVAQYETKLKEAQARAAEDRDKPIYDGLNRRWTTEAERGLLNARFVAERIDTYAADWVDCDHRHVAAFLWRCHRHGISQYWSVNRKPPVVDEAWRVAIREWLSEIMPPLNGLMGRYTGSGFVAAAGYEKVFDWVMATDKAYETEDDRRRDAQQNALAQEVVDEIIEEERRAAVQQRD